MWKGAAWRQPSPEERCTFHGLPPTLFSRILEAGRSEEAVAIANSIVGNGFHLPSVITVIWRLLADNPAKTYPRPGELA